MPDHFLDGFVFLGVGKSLPGSNLILGTARNQAHKLTAQQTLGRYAGDRIRGQLNIGTNGHGDDSIKALRINGKIGDSADLDAIDANVRTFFQATDADELGRYGVALNLLEIGMAIGKDQEESCDQKDNRPHNGLNQIAPHGMPLKLRRARKWPVEISPLGAGLIDDQIQKVFKDHGILSESDLLPRLEHVVLGTGAKLDILCSQQTAVSMGKPKLDAKRRVVMALNC